MKVFEAIARLAEMDPDAEIVTPQAPYGLPMSVGDDCINELYISDYMLEDGVYVGIGFSEEKAVTSFNNADQLEEDRPDPLIEAREKERKLIKEKEKEAGNSLHDDIVPDTPEDFKKIL